MKDIFMNHYNSEGDDDWITRTQTGVMEWDIKMRYLTSRELADVTGFPPDYDLGPNETTRKKHVGNAVPPVVPNKLAQCIWDGNFNPELENVTYIAA